ncbi:N-acyl amino acid synthase, PEP-CTERM/exosortase system-associated [Onishia taeanensis]|uniref:N-acyl amino acid synthase, PEP-CTERM/exosortase system-associated n=1 Tax=Onishia taeanensis TaxID=284577 RepID=A0A1G7SAT9_9GAMM|nr:PEP-CTERM/exosortase system-associated acyltransferase [Halomonas taeanensis]SDG20165.1 N-acyl amino acid synthase, PEP-CTERM/exosortase system-associated [Halomonas taeanensis]
MNNWKKDEDIYETFSREFSFKIASNNEEKMKAYAIRHQVYREEMKCDIGEKGTPYEYDEYDENSTLCIIIHRESGLPAGCLRLVSPDNTPSSPCYFLPLEKHCMASLTNPTVHPNNFKKEQTCEISRLAVIKEFRKKKDKQCISSRKNQKIKEIQEKHGHLFPLIGVSLFLASTAIAGISERHHVFAMMEKRFARLLGVSGINFRTAGSEIHYHGERTPFYIDQRDAETSIKPNLQKLYLSIKKDLEKQRALILRLSNQRTATIAAKEGSS